MKASKFAVIQVFFSVANGFFMHNGRSTRSHSTHLLSTVQTEATDVSRMTEGQILARNQGHLEMKTESQRSITKTKHDIEDSDFDSSSDLHGFGSVLMDDGVARIDNVLSKKNAERMRNYTNNLLKDTSYAVEKGIFPELSLFGNVYCKENRYDLLLPIEASEIVMDCLSEVLCEGSPISTAIESVLGSDAELYELSTLISDPNSSAQPLHPDILYQDTIHPILTCFIALQDIDEQMGPTVFMPKSANKEHHDDLGNRHLDPNANGLVATSYNVLGTLDSGDCTLYSAMTLHCGSANKSNKRRSLFYFSFRNNDLLEDEGGRMNVSLRPELKDRNLTLKTMQDLIENR
ncbi:hypothetical protein CTEN210_15230 [Chaetoceros tenuissimus]|uniref:Phytanoyl-CoA dioxygenase n=1 Tax=Chaetoceros tenuissimus TaxID=426638 RepID=A0AAD3D9X7_9STRA|nr:hypothetical protein CTEN210_15230 [Chaetoceros tenuissimus]